MMVTKLYGNGFVVPLMLCYSFSDAQQRQHPTVGCFSCPRVNGNHAISDSEIANMLDVDDGPIYQCLQVRYDQRRSGPPTSA